jgi:cytochrome c-type biogenesis protein
VLDSLATAFGLGLVATVSPCALPLYPGFIAYVAARSGEGGLSRPTRWLGLAVLAGVLSMMLALGALIAALSVAIGQVLALVTPLADLVVITLGVVLLLGRNPFARLPTLGAVVGARGPLLSAYVYGLLYGPIALPCSGALLVSVFTISLTVASFAEKLIFFLAFGLGFGVPLLALSFLAAARGTALVRRLLRWHGAALRVAGAVLIVVGALDFERNLPFLRLYLGLA